MPYVKVPGIDREIWFDLHDPEGPETPWFVAAGTEVMLTPEQIAAEMADPKSDWDFSFAHETATKFTRDETEAHETTRKTLKETVTSFERLLRKTRATLRGLGSGGRGRGGKPVSTFFSIADDIAVFATYFMRNGMKRQAAINQAVDYWINGNKRRMEPSKRLIDAALARIRRGGIADLSLSVAALRVKYRLPELPPVQLRKAKPTGRIK